MLRLTGGAPYDLREKRKHSRYQWKCRGRTHCPPFTFNPKRHSLFCFVFLKSHMAQISHRAWKTKPIKAERRTCTAALRFWCLQWWRGHHHRRHHCHCHFQHPPQQPLLQAKHTRRTGSYLRSSWQAIRKSHDRNKIKKQYYISETCSCERLTSEATPLPVVCAADSSVGVSAELLFGKKTTTFI